MGYRSFVALMAAVAFVACALLAYVIYNVNPDDAGLMGLTAFYIALYASLVGLISFGGIIFRVHIRGRKQTAYREVRIAFRHGLLLAGIAVSSLILSSLGYLAWWNFLLILAAVGTLEYVFLTIQESRRG
ncbi:hypothetical protein K8R04_02755 [Candidatus Uhrbacteria bacterium]|nr:hypothetical protein [Candidatus Uhrbacteria bacterium]